MTAIGWYGLGAFGLPMACHLVSAGFSVRAESGRGRVAELVAAGGLGPGEELAGPRLIALCLPSGTEVVEVAQHVSDAACVVDFSSHDPRAARDVAELLRERGIGYVDCPVSGSENLARDGRLTGYAGACEGDLDDAVRGLISAVCENVFWTGGLGQGQAMKLVNQVVHLGNVLVLGEGFELANALGLEPDTVLDALNASSGSSRMLERFGRQMMDEEYPRQFSARLACKDIVNVLRQLPDLPVAGLVEERLRSVVDAAHGDENFTRLARRQG